MVHHCPSSIVMCTHATIKKARINLLSIYFTRHLNWPWIVCRWHFVHTERVCQECEKKPSKWISFSCCHCDGHRRRHIALCCCCCCSCCIRIPTEFVCVCVYLFFSSRLVIYCVCTFEHVERCDRASGTKSICSMSSTPSSKMRASKLFDRKMYVFHLQGHNSRGSHSHAHTYVLRWFDRGWSSFRTYLRETKPNGINSNSMHIKCINIYWFLCLADTAQWIVARIEETSACYVNYICEWEKKNRAI